MAVATAMIDSTVMSANLHDKPFAIDQTPSVRALQYSVALAFNCNNVTVFSSSNRRAV
jgi:hypothetical protein